MSDVEISSLDANLKDDTGLMLPPDPGIVQASKDWLYRRRARLDDNAGFIRSSARALAAEIDWIGWQPDRPTILCFSRATFNKDVDEMRRRTNLNLVGLRTAAVKRQQERWIPPEWRVQTYFTGLLNQELKLFRPHLVSFGRELLAAAGETHPIDAMMAANSDYWQDEAMRLAGREMGIPFITLCRENYTIPVDQKTVMTRFVAGRFRYTGTAIAVYSTPTKAVMEQSRGFSPDIVEVTGAPRFDRWRDIPSLALEKRDCLTLISFASPLYYAPVAYREAARAIAEAYEDSVTAVQLVVKVKKKNEISSNREAAPELDRVKANFTADWSLFDLLPRSRAVIGYNSMAMAEGLLTDLPVIIPYWGDAIQPERSMFSPEFQLDRDCIYFPESPVALKELVKKLLSEGLPAKGSIEDRRRCFSKVIETPVTTTSSALVEALIRRHLPERSIAP